MKTNLFFICFINFCTRNTDACEDEKNYLLKGVKGKNCDWAKARNKCHAIDPTKNKKILNFCKLTCGVCKPKVLLDDGNYRFEGSHQKSCKWVGVQCKRCNFKDKSGLVKVKVKDKCRKTCDHCEQAKGRDSSRKVDDTGRPVAPQIPKKDIGEACSNENECITEQCNGVCIQNSRCRSLDGGTWQDEFNRNMLIMVYVGSGFTNAQDFAGSVQKTHDEVKSVEMFDNSSREDTTRMRYRAFYVEKESKSFCNYGCDGIDRLLCCDESTTRSLANLCFPQRSTLQTIVIHNDTKYGGAGYADANIAVISTSMVGPKLAIHELGHSLFEFGDEYTYGTATDEQANCDLEGCPKWNDLVTRGGRKGPKLCESRGGENGNYYVGQNSFMRNMFMPVGIVNLRFTCCTYLALTKSFPTYCDQFQFGKGLERYCADNDYQGYGREAYSDGGQVRRLGSSDSMKLSRDDVSRHKVVSNPVYLQIGLESKEYQITTSNSTSKMFRHHSVHGDFEDFEAAKAAGLDSAHKVEVYFESGEKQNFVFGSKVSISVPPADPYDDHIDLKTNELEANNERGHLQIVVEGSRGVITNVEIGQILL